MMAFQNRMDAEHLLEHDVIEFSLDELHYKREEWSKKAKGRENGRILILCP